MTRPNEMCSASAHTKILEQIEKEQVELHKRVAANVREAAARGEHLLTTTWSSNGSSMQWGAESGIKSSKLSALRMKNSGQNGVASWRLGGGLR